MADRMQAQRDEFDAADNFAKQLSRHKQTSIVDDDYPEVRFAYEGAMTRMIEAMRKNGRFEDGNRYRVYAHTSATVTPEMIREAEAHMPFSSKEATIATPRWEWLASFLTTALAAPGSICPCCNVTKDGDVLDHYPYSEGLDLIGEERRRQITQEGWTPEHDDEHGRGQLAVAAACYAAPERSDGTKPRVAILAHWPWMLSWWKPGDRIRELTKAGALIAAEIDRLRRKERADV